MPKYRSIQPFDESDFFNDVLVPKLEEIRDLCQQKGMPYQIQIVAACHHGDEQLVVTACSSCWQPEEWDDLDRLEQIDLCHAIGGGKINAQDAFAACAPLIAVAALKDALSKPAPSSKPRTATRRSATWSWRATAWRKPMTDRTPIAVPADVMAGLEAVRRSGGTNMLDWRAVIEIAEAMEEAAAARWVRDHKSLYVQGIFRGFRPETQEGAP